jgi:hypothetical protein
MTQFYDPITGAPVWLDRDQPIHQVDVTVALLRIWQAARPQQVRVDIYVQPEPEYVWSTCRN